MSSMRRELLFLKKKVASLGTQSFEEMPENVIVQEDSEEKSVVVPEDTNIMRIKRNVKNGEEKFHILSFNSLHHM